MVSRIKAQLSLFFLYAIICVGETMKIAIDKKSLKAYKQDKNEYIYLYDNEDYKDLLKLKMPSINYKYCDYVDINLTDYDVECFKKATINDKDYKKLPEKKNFKIGIIIPNCNYEHTLEKCLTSILNQTYQNFEIIFVDDVSTDDSVKIARELLRPQDKIIELKQKRYNGGARNEAYLHLSDDNDYVWYVDSDDWVYDDRVLEKINNKLQSNPDVLFVGMAQFMNNTLTTCFIPQYKDKYDAIKGWSGSCGKVIKKSLATQQKCLYNEGTLKEDKNQHCKICIYMNTFKLLQEPVYVWNRDNNKSVTTIRDEIIWGTSTIRHYADTKQLLLSVKGKDKKIDEFLEERLNQCKLEMEMGGDRQW